MTALVLNVFRAELKRSWIILWRYPLQAISGIAVTLMLFLGMLAGVKYIAGPGQQFGDRLEAVIVGYLLWSTMVFAMGEIAAGLQAEGKIGTLEQLFLSPLRGGTIFLIRAVASQTVVLTLNIGVLGILLVVTQTSLHFPVSLVLPLATALAGCYGLGFILGSLALLYKRIGPLVQLSQFALMAFVMVPFESWNSSGGNPYLLIPLVPSAALLRDLMARGTYLDLVHLTIAVANSGVYLSLGLLVFHWSEERAKRLGLLGTY